MRYLDIITQLDAGESVTLHPPGKSMAPMIKSGQRIVLSPVDIDDVSVGDAVLAKVKGRYYIHKVTAVGDDGRFQISNNHGHVNGWARSIYGKVTEIGEAS